MGAGAVECSDEASYIVLFLSLSILSLLCCCCSADPSRAPVELAEPRAQPRSQSPEPSSSVSNAWALGCSGTCTGSGPWALLFSPFALLLLLSPLSRPSPLARLCMFSLSILSLSSLLSLLPPFTLFFLFFLFCRHGLVFSVYVQPFYSEDSSLLFSLFSLLSAFSLFSLFVVFSFVFSCCSPFSLREPRAHPRGQSPEPSSNLQV